ncbi:hypothetical protein CWC22_006980 [Pseudoalteromonas rubra]|uniref:Uncharacterized protein n=1 Tax=Pseudoalteromonas rubra TaxID=43658 RepID=A0A7S8BNQ8_9GAMM|nr:hypothetical protein CWC22_006980 [Pseudoalteromonas rubra]
MGYSNKTIVTEDGAIDVETPRVRLSTFEPQPVKKQQTGFTSVHFHSSVSAYVKWTLYFSHSSALNY